MEPKSSSTGAGSQGQQKQTSPASTSGPSPEAENENLSRFLFIICASVAVAVIVWKVAESVNKYIRKVVCAGHDRQQLFALPSRNLSWIKRHLLYAPIWSKRHNHEIQLSSAINVGTLPTRLQFLFLLGYFASNAAFCVVDISFSSSFDEVANLLRNRTGVLATVNMIPLFVLAGRNNPLIPLLGISFDTYNLIHRWFGRIVVLEILAHVLSFLAKADWNFSGIFKTPFLLWGFFATCAVLAISVQAYSPIRHAFYEVFKLLHLLLAISAVIGIWYHLHMKDLPEIKYLYAAIGLWALERVARVIRVAYYHLHRRRTRTTIEALPGNACRVTVTLARPWERRPGQHAYLYMPTLSLMQSHPFSVAWNDTADHGFADKLPTTRRDLGPAKKTKISFIIRARTGFTSSLYKRANESPSGKFDTTCWVEGPYGAKHPFDSYGTVALFAGGVGITHHVPYVRDLVAGYGRSTGATRKILLVWVLQNPDHLEWIRPWMTEILAMDGRREVLRIMLFISQPRSSKEIQSASATVQMFPGRPNVETLLSREQDHQIGAMAVSVCGPGSFSDEVRLAVRRRQHQSNIDFVEEAFSW